MWDDELNKYIRNRKINIKKLIEYGFKNVNDTYEYHKDICNNKFEVIVSFNNTSKMHTKVLEKDFNEEYTLLFVEDATGEFVANLRAEYIEVIKDIYNLCSTVQVFKSEYTNKVIEYVKEKYDEDIEFLWEELDGTGVFRHKENKKWYGVVMTISKRKLGLDSDEIVEIIDLKIKPEMIDSLVDNKLYFRGYHMNKKHWLTIILDGSVELSKVLEYLDLSYNS